MNIKNVSTTFISKFLILITILFAVCLLICSCRNNALNTALKSAGKNRSELEKVLQHYSANPADSLKLKAAKFLIENMLYRNTLKSDNIDSFYKKSDAIFQDTLIKDGYEKRMDTLLSSIDLSNKEEVRDIETIKASFLISMIDQAFETRKYPWCKRLSFDDFCEYVLPYRQGTSPLENWRTIYQQRFSFLVDSLVNIDFKDSGYLTTMHQFMQGKSMDTAFASSFDTLVKSGVSELSICAVLSKQYHAVILYPRSFKPDLPPSSLLNIKASNCRDWTQLGIYALRSFGIPTANDFTPHWANRSGGHDWSLILLHDGKIFPWLMGYGYLGSHYDWFGALAKVYRHTTQIQPNSLFMQKPKEEIPEFFKNPYVKDVSHLYFKPYDLTIDLKFSPPVPKALAYIMVFDNQQWQPIHWGRIKNGKAVFTAMAKNCAYTAMYYHNNEFYPASLPFILNDSGKVQYLQPDLKSLRTIHLKRKYTNKKVEEWCERIKGAKFQLANKPDFSDSVTIYKIDTAPEGMYQTINVNIKTPYRYFRYLAPVGSPGDMAELEVYGQNDSLLNGEIIGDETSFLWFASSDKFKAFDKNVLTYFEAEQNKNVWIGMKFPKKEVIKKVIYLPHNDDNFIRQDELYELFYWNNTEWISLGQQKGEKAKQELIYKAPGSALFRLRNLNKGKEERIFTYENQKQVWW